MIAHQHHVSTQPAANSDQLIFLSSNPVQLFASDQCYAFNSVPLCSYQHKIGNNNNKDIKQQQPAQQRPRTAENPKHHQLLQQSLLCALGSSSLNTSTTTQHKSGPDQSQFHRGRSLFQHPSMPVLQLHNNTLNFIISTNFCSLLVASALGLRFQDPWCWYRVRVVM